MYLNIFFSRGRSGEEWLEYYHSTTQKKTQNTLTQINRFNDLSRKTRGRYIWCSKAMLAYRLFWLSRSWYCCFLLRVFSCGVFWTRVSPVRAALERFARAREMCCGCPRIACLWPYRALVLGRASASTNSASVCPGTCGKVFVLHHILYIVRNSYCVVSRFNACCAFRGLPMEERWRLRRVSL